MACTGKGFTFIFLAAFISAFFHVQGGDAQGGCHLSDIIVTEQYTNRIVAGQPEYRVTVENNCSCPQANVKVRCFGVASLEPVDHSRIRPVDRELCVVADGKPITKGLPVTFTYAAQKAQDFPVVSAKLQC